MKFPVLVLAFVLAGLPLGAHPHEWVDWGVGLVLDEKKPVKVVSARLELTWDEWYSALVLTDFPDVAKNQLKPADLTLLDTNYGLASPDRAVSLTLLFRGKPIPVKLVAQNPRWDGKQVTLIYSLALNLEVDSPSELRVEIYDPTYYTDMGIRSKAGGFFQGVKDPRAAGSFKFEQDLGHGYYGGSVFPEVVVFSLNP
jgi:ABC-type uncharacterized transport system substrate-binding protein